MKNNITEKQKIKNTVEYKINKLNKRKRNKMIINCFIIFVLFFFIIFGISWSISSFEYNLKLNIDYTGGYRVTTQVFNYNDANVTQNKPNGDAKKAASLMYKKLNPLGDKLIITNILGKHRLSITVPKSSYKNINQFINKIDSTGSLTLANSGSNILLNINNTGTSPNIKQTPILSLFNNAKSTVDKSKNPIISLNLKPKSNWSTITKKISGPIYMIRDIGQLIDNIRNDYTNFQKYHVNNKGLNNSFYKSWQSFESTTTGFPDKEYIATKAFAFEYTRNGTVIPSSIFGHPLNGVYGLNDIFRHKSQYKFKWLVNSNDLIYNTQIKDDLSSKNVFWYDQPYIKVISQLLLKNKDFQKQYSDFLVNKYQIDNDTSSKKVGYILDGQNIEIKQPTVTSADQLSSLINAGLQGFVYKTESYNIIKPLIGNTFWKATQVFLIIILCILFIYLLLEWRLLGFTIFTSFLFGAIMSLFILNSLAIQFSPILLLGMLTAISIVFFGTLLILKRYKKEYKVNKLPMISAIKISLKNTLPLFIDSMVILLIVAMSLFWLTTGYVKIFSISVIITLSIGFLSIFCITWFLYYLFIKINLLEKYKMLNIREKSFLEIFRLKNIKNKTPKIKKIKTPKVNNSFKNIGMKQIKEKQDVSKEKIDNNNNKGLKNEK